MKKLKKVLNEIFIDGLSGMATGLFATLEKGVFADIKRPRDGGKGLAGVVTKDDCYFNPFVELMHKKGGNE